MLLSYNSLCTFLFKIILSMYSFFKNHSLHVQFFKSFLSQCYICISCVHFLHLYLSMLWDIFVLTKSLLSIYRTHEHVGYESHHLVRKLSTGMLHDIKDCQDSKIKMFKIIYPMCHYENTKKYHKIYRWKTRFWLETNLAISPKNRAS